MNAVSKSLTTTAASPEVARAWVAAAIADSGNAERYGGEISAREITSKSSRTAAQDPALEFEFSGAKTVRIDLLTGEIAQTGALNDWIDATYRVHYLQWTPWKAVNIALVLLSTPLVLALAATGLRMAFARR